MIILVYCHDHYTDTVVKNLNYPRRGGKPCLMRQATCGCRLVRWPRQEATLASDPSRPSRLSIVSTDCRGMANLAILVRICSSCADLSNWHTASRFSKRKMSTFFIFRSRHLFPQILEFFYFLIIFFIIFFLLFILIFFFK